MTEEQYLKAYKTMSNISIAVYVVAGAILATYMFLTSSSIKYGTDDVVTELLQSLLNVSFWVQITVFFCQKFYFTAVAGVDWQIDQVVHHRRAEIQMAKDEAEAMTSPSMSGDQARLAKRIREERLDDLNRAFGLDNDSKHLSAGGLKRRNKHHHRGSGGNAAKYEQQHDELPTPVEPSSSA